LIWGIGKPEFNPQKELIKRLKYGKFLLKKQSCVKAFPISWTDKLKVTKMMWIGIFEIAG
jgi:hypothetical protein